MRIRELTVRMERRRCYAENRNQGSTQGHEGKHCTEQEIAAKKVERQVGKSAAAMLLEARIGERFDAIVTGAAPKGTWASLLDAPVEGRLVHGFEGIDVGQRIRVQLIHTDAERGFIDFTRVG